MKYFPVQVLWRLRQEHTTIAAEDLVSCNKTNSLVIMMELIKVWIWFSNSGKTFQLLLTCEPHIINKLTENLILFRINTRMIFALSFAKIMHQQCFTPVLHCDLRPLTTSLPVDWAHSSDLFLLHTNSCVGGSRVECGLLFAVTNR